MMRRVFAFFLMMYYFLYPY